MFRGWYLSTDVCAVKERATWIPEGKQTYNENKRKWYNHAMGFKEFLIISDILFSVDTDTANRF